MISRKYQNGESEKVTNKMLGNYLAKFVYRPFRRHYSINNLPSGLYAQDGNLSKRVPLSFKNSRDETIVGSLYLTTKPLKTCNPCVIYLHGNCSSQNEGTFLVHWVSHLGVNVCCIDCSGCGESTGKHIGLGVLEREDVKATIKELREHHSIDKIILLGRSMGACTSVWYASENNDIDGIICDSPYLSLRDIANDFIERNKYSSLLWFVSLFLYPWLNIFVKFNAKFSMNDINITNILSNGRAPALFVHAYKDSFIGIRETREIFANYGGKEKYFMTCEGDHNDVRPLQVKYQYVSFICKVFGIANNEFVENGANKNETDELAQQHFRNIADMMKH